MKVPSSQLYQIQSPVLLANLIQQPKVLDVHQTPEKEETLREHYQNTYSTLTQKPTYNVRHEADTVKETTPGALYVDLEEPTSGQDYETLNGDDQYLENKCSNWIGESMCQKGPSVC